jgi:hypothetical protein
MLIFGIFKNSSLTFINISSTVNIACEFECYISKSKLVLSECNDLYFIATAFIAFTYVTWNQIVSSFLGGTRYNTLSNAIQFYDTRINTFLWLVPILDSKEINAEDIDFRNITSSLTRKQAEAVKRRVNKLNAKVKERLSLQETSEGPQRLFAPENVQNNNSKQRADVRSIFPMQTVGEASNKPTPPYRSRHSYSEGVPLSRSEVRTKMYYVCSLYVMSSE